MIFDDEKDYIMRIIKEMVRVLFSLMLGKKYVAVEMEHDFSREEVLDGISRLMRQAGYADVIDIVEGTVIT